MNELLEALLEEQRETNKWLRVLAIPSLVEGLGKLLSTPEERRVYQCSQGGTLRDVGKAAGVSHTTVQAYWRRWSPTGLVEQVAPGRYRRIADLTALGMGKK